MSIGMTVGICVLMTGNTESVDWKGRGRGEGVRERGRKRKGKIGRRGGEERERERGIEEDRRD